ncbi:zinc finger BED domain-containing protein DAYSLEEPER-like protein [Tanacetum coccineum]
MNDMMDPKRCGDLNGHRSEDEESKNPLFKGDGSSLFVEADEWEGDGVADDNYEEALVFDEEIVSEFVGKGFVDKYPNLQEDENDVSFSGVVLGLEVESMPVYDTDIEDVIKEEEGFVRKGGFGWEEDNIEDVVVVANDLCSSMIQTTLSVDFSKIVDSNLHELIWLQKGNFVEQKFRSYIKRFNIRHPVTQTPPGTLSTKAPSKIRVQAAGPIKALPRRCKEIYPSARSWKEYFPRSQTSTSSTKYQKHLSLDEQDKMDSFFSTYEKMLVGSIRLKEEFSRLDCPDYFKSPSGEDWNLVDNLCTYLKLIFDTASMMASSNVPTANTFFYEAWKIQLELTCASTSEDNIISTITKPMLEGFDKYWKSSCFVLAIAVVMDPRFKMKLVDFCFAKIFGDEAASYINIVDEGIHQLFLDYAAGDVTGYLSNGDGHGLGHTYFDDFIMESASQQSKSELDQYLEESLLPRSHEFDVMRWWKLNEPKYPTLSKMARDILTLPVSTVDPESVFDTGVKEMDRYRCALKPETVEALYCAKDWLRTESIESMDSLVKMEFQI